MTNPELGNGVWTFMVPDVIHTVIMGDYLYQWIKKVKEDKLDPLVHELMSV